MDKEIILVVLLVGLVVLGGAQAMQIDNLKDDFKETKIIGNVVNTVQPTNVVKSSSPPTMVGGC